MRHDMEAIGRTAWVIADGYIPATSNGPEPEMVSHESFCVLNTGDSPAHVEVLVYYADREPVGPYRVEVAPRRTRHVRFNDLIDPEALPLGTEYAAVVQSDVPVVVQHTRLDSRQAENAVFSTIAYAV
jgi:hypothetical protein